MSNASVILDARGSTFFFLASSIKKNIIFKKKAKKNVLRGIITILHTVIGLLVMGNSWLEVA